MPESKRAELESVAQTLVASGKGILAMDESNRTCNMRFAAVGIEETEDARRRYRELLVTADGIGTGISGAILYDETIRQETSDGVPLPKLLEQAEIFVGIKVDTGAHPLAGHPGETVTEGLDGLRTRLVEYKELGAVFAKWRAVIAISGDDVPSRAALIANSHALARYAALCQEAGLVPIVEPEVLMDGAHGLARCEAVTRRILENVFSELGDQTVHLPGIVLKPSMVLPGTKSSESSTVNQVAERTLEVLADTVPASVPGIAFLSGGQSDDAATAHLNKMSQLVDDRTPWKLTFSYGRALQRQALETWAGHDSNRSAAQAALARMVAINVAASSGRA